MTIQTFVYALLVVWLILATINISIQISINIKQYKRAKELEKSIKNFDNTMGEVFKDVKRQEFLNSIEELEAQNEIEKEDEKENKQNGRK